MEGVGASGRVSRDWRVEAGSLWWECDKVL